MKKVILIVFMDMNNDIHATWLHKMFAEIELVKMLTQLHGLASAPATHQCAQLPIDGIYVSQHLKMGPR